MCAPPLREVDAAAPDGAVIGIIGENGAGKSRCCGWPPGIEPAGSAPWKRAIARLLGPDDPLDLRRWSAALEHTLARQDALVRQRAAMALDRLRRAGTTVLLVSHEEELLRLPGG